MGLSEKQVNRTSSKMPRYGDLLIAVAERKDEAAFSRIYQLISNKAFSLAYQITHSKELSEEAVQDGMLRVWRYAGSYDPSGNPRNWILTIVATSAVAALNKHKKAHSLDKKATRRDTIETDPNRDEQNETLTELRRIIDTLPQGRRQILALYFGAGMPQHAIGKTLGMPQRTVSDQILKTLDLIKTNLKESGLAALSAQNLELETALCSGWQLSIEAGERIQAACSGSATKVQQETIQHSKKLHTHSGTMIPMACALGIVSTVFVTGLLIFQPHPNANDTTINTAQSLNQRWTFNEGPPSDLIPITGKWHWRAPSNNTSGHMHVPANPGVFFMLPMAIPENPCVVSVRYRLAYFGFMSVQLYWMDGTARLPYEGWLQGKPQNTEHRKNHTIKLYIHENRIYQCAHTDQIHTILNFKHESASREMGLGFCNYLVEEISIRELQVHELPATIREAHKLKTPKFADKTLPHKMKLPDAGRPFKRTWSRGINSFPKAHGKVNASKQNAPFSNTARTGIPYTFPPHPHKITVQHAVTTTTKHPSCILHWFMDNDVPMPYQIWENPIKTDTPKAPITHFMFDQYVVTFIGNTLISVVEFEIPYPGWQMRLTPRYTFLQKFTVEKMKLKDMPHKVQRVEALIQELKKRGVQAQKHGVYWK